jgi:predicted dehydrogenase
LSKVRIGIIGPSWWVDYWHLPALLSHPDAEIAALCASKLRDPAAVAEKYGAGSELPMYTDYCQMMDEIKPDGVIICTPNVVHHPATMEALKRGIHVNTEKPVAMDAAQAREMAETAAASGLLGMCNFPYRSNPAAKKMKQLIAEGFIGDVLHVSGQYHGGFGLSGSPNWRGSRTQSGSGILGDLGSHLIDLAWYTTGEDFSSVTASSMTVLRDATGPTAKVRTEDPRVGDRNDDSCAFLAEFKSGAQGIFHTSWIAYQAEYVQHQELEVYGSAGRLRFLATHTGTFLRGLKMGTSRWETFEVEDTVLHTDHGPDDEDYFRPGRLNGTNNTYRWVSAIRDGEKSISPDLVDGLRSQLVIDAVIEASAERKWVDVQLL